MLDTLIRDWIKDQDVTFPDGKDSKGHLYDDTTKECWILSGTDREYLPRRKQSVKPSPDQNITYRQRNFISVDIPIPLEQYDEGGVPTGSWISTVYVNMTIKDPLQDNSGSVVARQGQIRSKWLTALSKLTRPREDLDPEADSMQIALYNSGVSQITQLDSFDDSDFDSSSYFRQSNLVFEVTTSFYPLENTQQEV